MAMCRVKTPLSILTARMARWRKNARHNNELCKHAPARLATRARDSWRGFRALERLGAKSSTGFSTKTVDQEKPDLPSPRAFRRAQCNYRYGLIKIFITLTAYYLRAYHPEFSGDAPDKRSRRNRPWMLTLLFH